MFPIAAFPGSLGPGEMLFLALVAAFLLYLIYRGARVLSRLSSPRRPMGAPKMLDHLGNEIHDGAKVVPAESDGIAPGVVAIVDLDEHGWGVSVKWPEFSDPEVFTGHVDYMAAWSGDFSEAEIADLEVVA